jgi:hypothetical protein
MGTADNRRNEWLSRLDNDSSAFSFCWERDEAGPNGNAFQRFMYSGFKYFYEL